MSYIKITEQPSLYNDLEKMSPLEILTCINREDHKVADAVQEVIPAIEKLVVGATERMKQGGRLIYTGCGTSGRLGVLDASECPPTYGVSPDLVVGIIAGGDSTGGKAFLEEIEVQDSAKPYHDWNARIVAECYTPNSVSKIVTQDNKILDIVIRCLIAALFICAFFISLCKKPNLMLLVVAVFFMLSKRKQEPTLSIFKFRQNRHFDKVVILKIDENEILFNLIKQIKSYRYTIFYIPNLNRFFDEEKIIEFSLLNPLTQQIKDCY